MGLREISGRGEYAPGERHLAVIGDGYEPGAKRLVVFFTGAAGNERRFLEDEYAPLTAALTEAGYAVISSQFGGGYQWGNELAQARIGELWRYGVEALKARPGPLLGVGVSKGATALLNYSRSHAGDVAAVAALIPAVDVADIHRRDPGMAAEIEAAFGGPDGYREAIADHNPAERAEDFRQLALECWLSEDDPAIPAQQVRDFARRAGASTNSVGSSGHSIVGIDPAQVVGFFERQG